MIVTKWKILGCQNIYINELYKYVLLNILIFMNLKHISPISWIHNKILKFSTLFCKPGYKHTQEHSGMKLMYVPGEKIYYIKVARWHASHSNIG